MKLQSCFSLMRGIGSILVILLFANCQKEDISTQLVNAESSKFLAGGQSIGTAQILSQTRTPNSFDPYGLNQWFNTEPQFLSGDDNLFTYSRKINSIGRVYLIVQDFRFDIPPTATITNIIVGTRRFKKGKASLKDCFVHLTMDDYIYDRWLPYGVQMAKPDLWKTTETEVVYSQPGAGNNGMDIKSCLCSANQQYQWTPAIINGARFGVYLLTNFPSGGSVEVYYDQIQITVEYSMP